MIDSGASNNFIYDTFVNQHKIKTELISRNNEARVKLANGEVVRIQKKSIFLDINILNHHSSIEFFIMNLSGYDAILGMSWIITENPTIDWLKKEVLFSSNKTGNFLSKVEQESKAQAVQSLMSEMVRKRIVINR